MLRFLWITQLALFATLAAAAQTPDAPPKSYDCYRTATPISIDGKLNDPAWKSAPWTPYFIDIQGSAQPKPRFRTRMKMLWDDNYIYIGAELEEPNIRATLTQHDSLIFHDNDFEFFLKPLPSATGYFEFEINALNTTWDLYLDKPYREGGKSDSSWEIPGVKTAVNLRGTLNQGSDKDHGWSVEIAIPWSAFNSRLPVTRPEIGSQWRANFSRVEWKPGILNDWHSALPGQHREDNWVWTSQGEINMHAPDKWGYINFRGSR